MFHARIKSANVMANAIDLTRVVMVILAVLGTSVFAIETSNLGYPGWTTFVVLALGSASVLFVYGMFGWFVHTLRMLAVLAQYADMAAVEASR